MSAAYCDDKGWHVTGACDECRPTIEILLGVTNGQAVRITDLQRAVSTLNAELRREEAKAS